MDTNYQNELENLLVCNIAYWFIDFGKYHLKILKP